jgi:predicted transcriptional regulator
VASSMNERIKQLLEDLTSDPVEERVVEYVIREVNNGRSLMEVINDPYVRNRLSDEKREEILANPDVLDALEHEIQSAFKAPDIGYSS